MNSNLDRLTARISENLIKRVKIYAALKGKTLSQVIAEMIETKFPTDYIVNEQDGNFVVQLEDQLKK